MSLDEQELTYFQQVTKLFGNMMSESQISFLASLAEKVSDMEETLDSSPQNLSQETT